MGRLLDRLLIKSSLTRRRRQMERESAKRNAEAVAEHSKRQAHYREVTHSDSTGRNTKTKP